MADGTSVGKISLEVDLQGDINQQVSELASNIGKSLKTSLESASKGMLTGLESVIEKSMTGINTSIEQGLDKMKTQMESFITSLQAMTKKIKVPMNVVNPSNLAPAIAPSIPTSSPRGPPIATPKLDAGIDAGVIQAEIDSVTRSLDLVNQKIELQQEKLVQLKASYERALNPNTKNKLAMQIVNTETSINKLIETSDKMGFKLSDLDGKLNGTGQALKKVSAAVNDTAKKATATTKPLGAVADVVGKRFDTMGRMINQALKRVLIMGTLYKVIRGFMSYLGSALATNAQFASSLAQVKTNLQVAFMPIYQAILPALNALMRTLSSASAFMATFLSTIMGKTYAQSLTAAKGLNTAKTAVAGVGGAAKKTAKDIQLALAGFDEITNLDTGAGDAGGGGAGGAALVAPSADTSAMGASIQAFLDKLNPMLEPAIAAFGRLKTAFEPLGANLGAGLKWIIDNVLVPLGSWVISELIPRFFDGLASVFKIVNGVIEALKPLWKWLWDNLFAPLAKWTGGVILKVLDSINAGLSAFGDWIANNKGFIETLVIIVGSFAAAWGLVNAAFVIWFGLMNIFNAVMAVATAVGTGFAGVMAFIATPAGIAILAIGALIAIGILLWKNWDDVSAWLKKTWEGIKTTASTVWYGIVNTIKGVFAGIGKWFSDVFTGAWNGIKTAFSAVGSFFSGIWATIKSTFSTIGTTIGNAIGDAFKYVVNSIIRFAENSINGFIRAINGAINLINKIPGVNIKTISTLNIPKLATGGMIDQPTLAMVGERGKEAVVPLDQDRGAMQQIADMLVGKMDGGGEDTEFVGEVDGEVLFRVVINRLNKKRRQKGLPIIEY
jgi:phage-related protein